VQISIALKECDLESGGRRESAKQGHLKKKLDYSSSIPCISPKYDETKMSTCRYELSVSISRHERDFLISITRSSRDESIAMTQATFTSKDKHIHISNINQSQQLYYVFNPMLNFFKSGLLALLYYH